MIADANIANSSPRDTRRVWLPLSVRKNAGSILIDWMQVHSLDFTQPYFAQSIEHFAAKYPNAPRMTTPISGLLRKCEETKRDPLACLGGLIFHVPRSRSTLLTQMLMSKPRILALSEPTPINDLLFLHLSGETQPPDSTAAALRALTIALCEMRASKSTRVVLKFTSWNAIASDVIAKAFPNTPVVLLTREAAYVEQELSEFPAPWQKDKNLQRILDSLLASPGTRGLIDNIATSVKRHFPLRTNVFSADQLPDVVWTRIAGHFGFRLSKADVARMTSRSNYHSKFPNQRFPR